MPPDRAARTPDDRAGAATAGPPVVPGGPASPELPAPSELPEAPAGLHADDAAALDALVRLASGRPSFSTTLFARVIDEHPRFARVTVEAGHEGVRLDVVPVDDASLPVRDRLTGLPSRALVRERLVHAIATCERSGDEVAVLHIDVDGFQLVNNSVGDSMGDVVLCRVADRIASELRPEDTLGRLGGDTFCVVATGIRGVDEARALGERLRLAVAERDDGPVRAISVSIGITVGDAGADAETLAAEAEHASRVAKREGRDRCRVFDAELRSHSERRVVVDTELRRGLDDGTLEVHFQPIIDLGTVGVVGAEALMRVYAADGSLLAPRELLAAANENGLLRRVEAAVMHTACRRAAEWREADHQVTVSVNLSDRQFHDDHLLALVDEALTASRLRPDRLMLEITEATLAADLDAARARIEPLRRLGVMIAIDEFCGSETIIDRLDVLGIDLVKLDRGLVHAHASSWARTILVSTLTALDRRRIPATAVAVETEEQLAAVRELGCRYAQGHLFTEAVPAATFPMVLGELQRVPTR